MRILLLLFPAMALSVAGLAQKGFYLRATGGHAGTLNGRLEFGPLYLQGEALIRVDGRQENNLKRRSLGAGTALTAAAGYRFGPHLAAELGGYALVAPAAYRYVRRYDYLTDIHIDESQARGPVYLMPALVLHSGTRLDGYLRLGAVLPVAGHTEYVHSQSVPSGSTGGGHNGHVSNVSSVSTHKVTHRFSPGLAVAIGAQYPVWKRLAVQLEASLISLEQWGRRQERVSYTENGADALASLSVSQKQSELSYSPVYGTKSSEPLQEPTYAIPYSSIGVSAGLTYRF